MCGIDTNTIFNKYFVSDALVSYLLPAGKKQQLISLQVG